MILKKLIAAAGLVGTLGAAAPAFADWYRPVPPPVVVTPPVVQYGPAYGYEYGYGYARRPDYDRFDRRRDWGRHWRWEHERREHERREHHEGRRW